MPDELPDKTPSGRDKNLDSMDKLYDNIRRPLSDNETEITSISVDGIGEISISEGSPLEPESSITKEGYVWKYNIKVSDGVLPIPTGRNSTWEYVAENQIDRKTYFNLVLSQNKDKSEHPTNFRILKSSRLDEELAMTMGAIATTKDAFIHKKKVKIQGKVKRHNVRALEFYYFILEIIEILNS